MSDKKIDPAFIADHNEKAFGDMQADYAALGGQVARRGVDIDALKGG
jgi:L-rhamnose isomerase